MEIKNNIKGLEAELSGNSCRLIAVSKTQPIEKLLEAYAAGQRLFGENKAQEMAAKQGALPNDVEWHMIGHLQTNKVKYIAPFVALIHSVDSLRLLEEINKQGKKFNRIIPCLLQVYIAQEETKFGFDPAEVLQLAEKNLDQLYPNVEIKGLMGMATLTDNTDQIRAEFQKLKNLFDQLKNRTLPPNMHMQELSMGMSADYKLALATGSTLVRVGTAIFGERIKANHE
ncbi:MAG: YggS family pyridoxal phosphate-dependent enzyme [Cyclobacteriaceae bacterium]|nr:YggS family pyridoxal phosphate-dependent enzyme [Cyclobacteriaceae bacterium]